MSEAIIRIKEMTNETLLKHGIKAWGKVSGAEYVRDLVRCGECKHCHYEEDREIYHCYKLFHRFYALDGYCNYGERKDQ